MDPSTIHLLLLTHHTCLWWFWILSSPVIVRVCPPSVAPDTLGRVEGGDRFFCSFCRYFWQWKDTFGKKKEDSCGLWQTTDPPYCYSRCTICGIYRTGAHDKTNKKRKHYSYKLKMTYCTTMETDQRRGDFGRYFSDTCIFGSFFFAWMYFSIPPPPSLGLDKGW